MDFPINEGNFSSKNLFFQNKEGDFDVGPSMVDISNVKFERRGTPREGSYYVMPREVSNLEWFPITESDKTSANFLALKSDGSQKRLSFNNALNYRGYSQNLAPVTQHIWNRAVEPVFSGFSNGPKGIEVTVYNVGQGNWNEIIFNEEAMLIYDIGSSTPKKLSEKIEQVLTQQERRFRLNRFLDLTVVKKRVLIISHWDIDHYNGIFSLPDEVIRSINFCIVPNRIENDTTRRAVERLQGLTTVYPVAMAPKVNGPYGASGLHQIFTSGLLKMYKGTNCNDRNKRGLTLSLHTDDNDFIFPGDHHYHQIDRHIEPNCNTENLNIVVPHHGGRAGSPNCVSRWNDCEDAIISSGGLHGHPFESIEFILNNKFNLVYRTDERTDYNVIIR